MSSLYYNQLFIPSRSENIHTRVLIFLFLLQNYDKNKLCMLHYLLYIIIQRGIPAMSCLDAVLTMRETEFYESQDGGWSLVLGETAWGSAIGSFVLQCPSFIAVFPAGQSMAWQPPSKRTNNQRADFHHEEGAPTLLFLMVASEHSASEESQSESPNCSGFWKKNENPCWCSGTETPLYY